ncbi:MAG: TlpA family protein disulfide reductase [Caldilinea sp.]
MSERFVILAVVLAAALLVYALWKLWQGKRLRSLREITRPVHLPPGVTAGKPTVLYFTTSDCAQCRYQQTPILTQLQARVDVAVHRLDAIEQQTLAKVYGIMTVPTTVVLDPELRPVAINHGVAPLQKLHGQVTPTTQFANQ